MQRSAARGARAALACRRGRGGAAPSRLAGFEMRELESSASVIREMMGQSKDRVDFAEFYASGEDGTGGPRRDIDNDPVRMFERFSTLHAASNGRAEVILGLSRFNLKYSVGLLAHDKLMRCIEVYGTRVSPLVRELLR